jgi:hypothetical protein
MTMPVQDQSLTVCYETGGAARIECSGETQQRGMRIGQDVDAQMGRLK